MVALSLDELGAEGFKAHFPHLRFRSECNSIDEIMGRLLTTVYQRTANSGPVTQSAAQRLAEAVGAEHHLLDVGPTVSGYVSLLESALGRHLTWEHDDLALQNIQARARAPSVWMFANIKGALLLSTSNRSEAAVGYATMDGDTAGGLSPIAGIDKAFLLAWLKWLEEVGPKGMGPIHALDVVNAQVPTAELRPPGAHQTDEADLMPYPILDAIERAAIRDRLSPLETFEVLRGLKPDIAAAQLGAWVERFFRLWCRNQWKRERYAPSFHLDDENLDPKTWCRFPILSGGYEVELEELREALLALD
jgi:NAD+ synthase (glutamine-hydrolysing)